MMGRVWNRLWESYYVRVIRLAFWDSLFFVNWKVETGVYSALTLGFAILAFWIIAGPEATQQRLTVVIAGLIGAGCAFGLVFARNLYMAPIRMERELKAEAEKWHGKLKAQIRQNQELSESPKYAAQAGLDQPLSDEAKELLLEAVKDKGGYVARRESVSGIRIQTNWREFGKPDNARDQATWEAALDELHNGQLVQYQNSADFNRVFRVTKAGYDMAEKLTKPDD